MSTVVEIGSRAWLVAGWTMLHFLWIGGLISILALVGRYVLRKAGSEIRYSFALACFFAFAIAPLIIARQIMVDTPATAPAHVRPIAVPIPVEGNPSAPEPIYEVLGATVGRSASILEAAPTRIKEARPKTWELIASFLPWIWLIGAPTTFAWLATGLIGAERLKQRSQLVDDEIALLCRRLASALGVVRPVAVAVCERIHSPILLGVAQPIILLPIAALGGWAPDRLEMVLLHELAHVRRWDNLVNLFQRSIESILFFHPAVWVLSAWIRLERESCCDRMVVAQTRKPREYAETLLALSCRSPVPHAGLSMAHSQLVIRVRRILNAEDHSMRLSRLLVAFAAVLLLAPVLMIATQARQTTDRIPQKVRADAAVAMKRSDQDLRSALNEAKEWLTSDRAAISGRSLAELAQAQVEAGDDDGAKATYRAANKAAQIANDGKPSAGTLLLIGSSQVLAGHREGAREPLREASKILGSNNGLSSTGTEPFLWERRRVGKHGLAITRVRSRP
jgi:beta-lactamase regulating signal transducer with metallopeptidase domain